MATLTRMEFSPKVEDMLDQRVVGDESCYLDVWDEREYEKTL